MRNRTKTVIAALTITGLAVVGMDAATYAGTGDSLLLGKFNKAGRTTHVKSTGNGPALSLHAKGKRPALAVDSPTRIKRLNADRVDGKHAAGLQNNVRVFTATSSPSSTSHTFQLPNFPKGRYQATYDVYMLGVAGSAAAPEYGYCYFQRDSATPVYSGYASSTSTGSYAGVSASDIINKGNATWSLRCFASENWSASAVVPVRVTVTRVDKTIGGSLAASRTKPSADVLGR